MVWTGKGGEAPNNPPTGGSSISKLDFSALEKVGPGAGYYTTEGLMRKYNLIITDRRTTRVSSGVTSSDTVTLVYHWDGLDARTLRGVAWSSVIFVGTALYELTRVNPDALEAIKRGCLTHNTQILEV